MSFWDLSTVGADRRDGSWTALGRRKIGDVLVAAQKSARLVLPLSFGQVVTEKDELLVMVHVVLKGARDESPTKSQWTNFRTASPAACFNGISDLDSPASPAKERANQPQLKLFTTNDSTRRMYLDSTDQFSRFIGFCGSSHNGLTYRTDNVWLPVRGRYLFVENTSKNCEARISFTALAYRRLPDDVPPLSPD